MQIREAFASFAEGYFAPPHGVSWLKLGLVLSTALNAALLLRLVPW
jgi:hypothetical protein